MSAKTEDHACHCCHSHAACCDGDEVSPAEGLNEVMAVPAGYTLSRLRIAQMDCPTEEAMIRRKLAGSSEVHGLKFDLMQRVLTVVHTEGALQGIETAIRELGMVGEVLSGTFV